MTRRRFVSVVVVLMVLAVAAALMRPRHGTDRPRFEAVRVLQGEVAQVLHETARIQPVDPMLVKCAFTGRIQFIVEDGVWVEAGQTLFVLDEDEESARVADDRSQLLGVRQELRLAKLKREQSEAQEAAKRDAARRSAELETLRAQVVETTPQGGDTLIRLHEQLLPLEAEAETARTAATAAERGYQAALDAYLALVDQQQSRRDQVARAQAQIDEANAQLETSAGSMERLTAAERVERERAQTALTTAQAEFARAQAAQADDLPQRLAAAQTATNAAKSERDRTAAAVAEQERTTQPLYVQIEIEKRGATAAALALDEESQRLALAEAERLRTAAAAGVAAQAMAQSALDDRQAEVDRATAQLAITRERLTIARRGATAAELTEAHARRERAQAKADAAQAAYERALAVQDQEIALLDARQARLAAGIERRSRNFPSLIESYLATLQSERALLEADELTRRSELDAELARLQAQLVAAKAKPPGVQVAPVAGVARVKEQDDRKKQAGDKGWEDDTLVELFPPERMAVLVAINEVNVRLLKPGQVARITVPALKNAEFTGVIATIAGVGKDKFSDQGGFADVTQFLVRITLDQPSAELRQGMTALVALTIDRRADVLWLPRAAVRLDSTAPGKGMVLSGDARAPQPHAISIEPVGDDAVVITSGLNAGDTVFIDRGLSP